MNKHNYLESRVKKDSLYYLSIVLLWGAVWGLVEATMGNLLHTLPFRVPTGSVLFPIGYFFMQIAFKETKDVKSIFYTALIASSIKLVNLFSPTTLIIKVLNPSACIILEGLMVAVVFKVFEYKDSNIKYIHSLIMALSWRIGYYILCFSIFIPLDMMKSSSIVAKDKFIEFFIINGLINSIIIFIYGKVINKVGKEIKFRYNPLISTSFLLLALFVQWIN